MTNNVVRICRLCLNIIRDANFESLESYRTEMLKTVLVSLDISVSLNPIVCRKCFDTLQKCFEFKMTCLFSEDIVKSDINANKLVKVKLQDVCFKQLPKDDESCNGQKICRLCFSLVSESYTNVNDTLEDGSLRDMLKCCVPELNLELTIDVLVCTECLYLLRKQVTFISNCLESEKKIKTFCDFKGNDSSDIIDLCSVLQFYNKRRTENGVETQYQIHKSNTINIENTTEELDISDDMNDEYSSENEQGERGEEEIVSLREYDDEQCNDPSVNSNEDQPLHCPKCPYIAEDTKRFDLHSLQHKDPPEKTKFLRRHKLVHKDIPEDGLLRCHLCEFGFKTKKSLRAHVLYVHIVLKGEEIFKCEECDFQSKKKSGLDNHMLRHAPENALYKCKNCTYVTNRSSYLQLHRKVHKDLTELEIFRCNECDYQSKWRYNLKRHLLQHNQPKATYKCDKCDYSTSTFKCLEKHAKSHTDISEIPAYKCHHCDFETKRKVIIVDHVSLHNRK